MLISNQQQTKGNKVRYIDLTKPEDLEPTYNEFQIFGILASVVGIVGIIAFGAVSLISAL